MPCELYDCTCEGWTLDQWFELHTMMFSREQTLSMWRPSRAEGAEDFYNHMWKHHAEWDPTELFTHGWLAILAVLFVREGKAVPFFVHARALPAEDGGWVFQDGREDVREDRRIDVTDSVRIVLNKALSPGTR